MSDLRKLARGQECMVRIPGVCNGNPETMVLAHYRLAGECGMGIKPPDVMGAWCCAACHDAIDGRTVIRGLSQEVIGRDEIRLAHAEGVMRTLAALVRMGAIK